MCIVGVVCAFYVLLCDFVINCKIAISIVCLYTYFYIRNRLKELRVSDKLKIMKFLHAFLYFELFSSEST